MKLLASFPYLAALANAAAVELDQRATPSPLDFKIEMVGNSQIKASITNTGNSALRVFKTGSILDSRPIEKVKVSHGGKQAWSPRVVVPFSGMRVYVEPSLADAEEDFQTIAAGETVEVQWDAAEVHDLSAGGAFDFATAGALAYTYAVDGNDSKTAEIAGAAIYQSNVVTAHQVDGAAAASVGHAFHAKTKKRTTVQADCDGAQRSVLKDTLGYCRAYAKGGAAAASSGDTGKLEEYFKSSSTETRGTVEEVFNRIVSECGSSAGGAPRTHCADIWPGGNCQGGVVAYTIPWESYIVYCSSWFGYPATAGNCHEVDRPFIMLHETTHLTEVKGTQDYGCYGYECARGLSPHQNINHADTYALFANAIAVGC
ncbi:hypothetical protein DL764_009234 [Monosporascus ibericus]|uniref:Neutral protease 2 n=1 Tax=Monosporascus ibericus TaxID=155417 RepID=A0A4V1X914_9PEZI|nr:hypothetical protein DL764_009234 [Monosporascus ibericus]